MKQSTVKPDKPLFTPGPLSTSDSVKQAMLRDLGSRDGEFIDLVREIRNRLLAIAGVSRSDGFECVLMQGSGTFGIEAVLTCALPSDATWLIAINGAYGKRMQQIAARHSLPVEVIEYSEDELVSPEDIARRLEQNPRIRAVAVVHCETTTGIMNPVKAIGAVTDRFDNLYFVDSMSAFGGVEFDFIGSHIDFLVSSANKCIQGVPGFSFCIARKDALEATAGRSRTLSLDLFEQWRGLENNGQFRFTPPTHAMLAFRQALDELDQEGGVSGRQQRYQQNCSVLMQGMRRLGFRAYLPEERRGHIINSFYYPAHPRFDFQSFYDRLNDAGFVIYPGKLSNADCFRIGNVGHLFESDMRALLAAIEQTLQDMGVEWKPLASTEAESAAGA